MTLRERIADWLLGGKLCVLWAALNHIAAEEKPTSNATVKRMARIAREAME